jgi:hypothetical protein
MTTAEAREKLTQHGLTPHQAAGVVDVLEVWVQERAVTRDYLDARLAELKADLRKEMGDLKADLRKEIGDVREDMGNLKADLRKEIGDFRSELKGWVVTVAFLIQGVIGAATVGAVHYLVTHPPKAAQHDVTSR